MPLTFNLWIAVMITLHNLGFPRIGARRELKFALESYWAGQSSQADLIDTGRHLRRTHWAAQAAAGLHWLPVGDFAWYDPTLAWSCTLGVVPPRFNQDPQAPVDLDTQFRMARGRAPSGEPAAACEMTKWFDTNYHYLVPELSADTRFRIADESLFEQVREALDQGHLVKPSLPGPLSYLWLSKGLDEDARLALLPSLLAVYRDIFQRLQDLGVKWVQLDESILALDLPSSWQQAFVRAYDSLCSTPLKVLLAVSYGGLGDNLHTALELPVAGLHLDLAADPQQLEPVLKRLRPGQVLSAGVISGRNIWRTDLDAAAALLRPAFEQLQERLWLAPSTSLQHVPVDLDQEDELDADLKSWLSFALQKLEELGRLKTLLEQPDTQEAGILAQRSAVQARRASTRIHREDVQAALKVADGLPLSRSKPFAERIRAQQEALKLPLFPTTTIGSFPQTAEIRALRREWRAGQRNEADYEQALREEIALCVREQEQLGIDVLVHGEAERNDMVEYFGELLDGFAFTRFGWVQSYGSRCVKPPVLFGDVARPQPMTVEWSRYAQSLTERPMKGMLTGPVTVLQWSFVRDDQPRSDTCRQLALALRQEVQDLEAAGVHVIQIDEPALREGLPLRKADWPAYLRWAVDAFRLTTSGVQDRTQIHTHMCYAEFNDIIEAIAEMDADVITIETSRSNMELLEAFEKFHYPNQIGPGVYDIHSPNVPTVDWMVELMEKAQRDLPAEQLWVNPDCGLKTRGWPETRAALAAMVEAARVLRARHA